MLQITDISEDVMNYMLTEFIIKEKPSNNEVSDKALFMMLLVILSSKDYNTKFKYLIKKYKLTTIKCKVCRIKDATVYYNNTKKYLGGECSFCWAYW